MHAGTVAYCFKLRAALLQMHLKPVLKKNGNVSLCLPVCRTRTKADLEKAMSHITIFTVI